MKPKYLQHIVTFGGERMTRGEMIRRLQKPPEPRATQTLNSWWTATCKDGKPTNPDRPC